jgi:hypothetical protein
VITSSGQSGDLVPGDPAGLDDLVARLRRLAEQSNDAAQRLRSIESARWSGGEADRFRAAVSLIPEQLDRNRGAVTTASSVLGEYGEVLRAARARAAYAAQLADSATAATTRWRAAGALGPDPGADSLEDANNEMQSIREQLDTAGRTAASRLRAAVASIPKPRSEPIPGRNPGLHTGGATLRVATVHPLRDPDRFAEGAGHRTLSLRYGAAHHVEFADGTNDSASWESWRNAGEGRTVGQVDTEQLQALRLGVLSVAAERRRRSRPGRTAMAIAGADAAPLVGPRTNVGGGVLVRLRGPRTRGHSAWRTNLAHVPAARRSWPTATQRGVATADAWLAADAPSAARHNGPPGH